MKKEILEKLDKLSEIGKVKKTTDNLGFNYIFVEYDRRFFISYTEFKDINSSVLNVSFYRFNEYEPIPLEVLNKILDKILK